MTGMDAPIRPVLSFLDREMPLYNPSTAIMQARSAANIRTNGAMRITDGNTCGSVDKRISSSIVLLIIAALAVSFMLMADHKILRSRERRSIAFQGAAGSKSAL